MRKGDGALMAVGDAVHAGNTAARVDGVGGNVDAAGFAALLARFAADAFRRVNDGFEPRKPREKAQDRSHRADGVTPRSAAAPREKS